MEEAGATALGRHMGEVHAKRQAAGSAHGQARAELMKNKVREAGWGPKRRWEAKSERRLQVSQRHAAKALRPVRRLSLPRAAPPNTNEQTLLLAPPGRHTKGLGPEEQRRTGEDRRGGGF